MSSTGPAIPAGTRSRGGCGAWTWYRRRCNAPFHGTNFEAYVLHYGDYFAADRAMMLEGKRPFYQKPAK